MDSSSIRYERFEPGMDRIAARAFVLDSLRAAGIPAHDLPSTERINAAVGKIMALIEEVREVRTGPGERRWLNADKYDEADPKRYEK